MEFSQWFSNIFSAFVQDLNLGDFGTPPKYQATIESAPLRICLGRSQVLRRRPQRNTHDQTVLVGDNLGETPKVGFNTVLSLIVKFRMASPLQSSDVFNQVLPCYTRLPNLGWFMMIPLLFLLNIFFGSLWDQDAVLERPKQSSNDSHQPPPSWWIYLVEGLEFSSTTGPNGPSDERGNSAILLGWLIFSRSAMGGTWSERPLIDAIATTCQDQPRRNPNTFTEQIVCLPGLESHHRLTPMP